MNPFDLASYDFEFPEELIAHAPAQKRSGSRLMDFSRQKIHHRLFSELQEILASPCLFVRNVTRVRKARLRLKRATGAQIEALVLGPSGEGRWLGMFRPSKRLKIGEKLELGGGWLQIFARKEDGTLEFEFVGIDDPEALFLEEGEMPLPPYIEPGHADEERYQTVFARETGAAAAPTAGLHFDEELIENLKARNHRFLDVVLHVGPGTFKPVDTEDIRDFSIHRESIRLGMEEAALLREARQNGTPIIAVGTTSLRVLETGYRANGWESGFEGPTSLFLYPGQKVHGADFLITNLHLPKSSLLMLIAAFLGPSDWRVLYQEAIQKGYRFFSFGDAMLLPNLSGF